MSTLDLDPSVSTTNANGPIHQWFGLDRQTFLVLPRVALQELPLPWQRRLVALLREAEALGVETPVFAVGMKNKRGRFTRIPQQWLNYRHGTLRAAMATSEAEEQEG